MSPTVAHGKTGKVYRYYVSAPLQRGQKLPKNDVVIRRIPAGILEATINGILRRLITNTQTDPFDHLTRVEVHAGSVHLMLPVQLLPQLKPRLAKDEHADTDPVDPSRLRLVVPLTIRRRGGRTEIIGATQPATRPDTVLIKALRAAHQMVKLDSSGLPVLEASPSTPWRRRLVRLAFLAPDIQRAILDGRQPPRLTLSTLLENPLPINWNDQKKSLGFF
jgi:hypothetical protein